MTEVTQAEFFAALRADPRDIMPTVNEPLRTTWEAKDRTLFGVSLPGWKNPREPQKYMLVKEPNQ